MRVRPWHVPLLLSFLFLVMYLLQPDDQKPPAWVLAFMPLVTVVALVLDRTQPAFWRKFGASSYQKSQTGPLGQSPVLGPLRGHPSMWLLAAFGITVAVVCFAMANRTQQMWYAALGMFGLIMGSLGIGLASVGTRPDGSSEADTPSQSPSAHEPLMPNANPHGRADGKDRRTLIAAIALVAMGLAYAGFMVYDTGILDLDDERGYQRSTTYFMAEIGNASDQFTVTGTLSQTGTSRILAVPVETNQVNMTATWDTYPTDGNHEAVLEERVNGEWFVVSRESAIGSKTYYLEVEGDALRFTLNAPAAPADRTVNLALTFVQFMQETCTTWDGETEPECTLGPQS
ncbi:MAG: hypothetical protein ACPHK8_04405 [Thermoplasmatota archaeon]